MAADIASRSSLSHPHMRHELSIPAASHPASAFDAPRHQMQFPAATTAATRAASPAAAIRWIRGPSLGGNLTGKVSLALNSDTGEVLVVKSVSAGSLPKNMRQLENEHAFLEELRTCPRVVRLLGSAWETDPATGAPVKNLFLEYVSAGSVLDIMGTFGCCGGGGSGGACGGLPEPLVRKYARGIAEGLEELHARGIVHCDVKAANVLVAGAEGETKLCGLGMAMRAGEAAQRIARQQLLQGTYGWMAPEVVRQEDQGFASDVWSFACTVIEMATGLPPWTGQLPAAGNADGEFADEPCPDALLHAIGYSNAIPAIPPHLSAQAAGFLRRCLDKDPESRPSMAQLLEHPFLRASAALGSAFRPALAALPAQQITQQSAQQSARPPSIARGAGSWREREGAGQGGGAAGSWGCGNAGGAAGGAAGDYRDWGESEQWGEEETEGYGWEDIGVSFGSNGAEGFVDNPSDASLSSGASNPGIRPAIGQVTRAAPSGGYSGANPPPGRLVSQGSLPPAGNQLPPLRKSALERSQSQPGQVILANSGGGGNSGNAVNSSSSPSPPRPTKQKTLPPNTPLPTASNPPPLNPPVPAPLFHPSGIRMGPLMRQISKDQDAMRAAMAAAAAAAAADCRVGGGGNQLGGGGNQLGGGGNQLSGNGSNQGSAAPSSAPVPPLPGRGGRPHQRSTSVHMDFGVGDSGGSGNGPSLDNNRPPGRLIRGSSGALPGAMQVQKTHLQRSANSGEFGGVDSGRGLGGVGLGAGAGVGDGGPDGLRSCLRRTSSCVPGAAAGVDPGRGAGVRGGETGLQRMGSLTQGKKSVGFSAN